MRRGIVAVKDALINTIDLRGFYNEDIPEEMSEVIMPRPLKIRYRGVEYQIRSNEAGELVLKKL